MNSARWEHPDQPTDETDLVRLAHDAAWRAWHSPNGGGVWAAADAVLDAVPNDWAKVDGEWVRIADLRRKYGG
jgi:hypothetical protein